MSSDYGNPNIKYGLTLRDQKLLIRGVTYFTTILRKINSNSVEAAWKERNERPMGEAVAILWDWTEWRILEKCIESRLTYTA